MLGGEVQDPGGLEGKPGATRGLGLLPLATVLKAPKTTTLSGFEWDGVPGAGYEIHMGQTAPPVDLNAGKDRSEGLFRVLERNQQPCRDFDGAMSDNGRVMGTYMHGLFDSPMILKKWLNRLGIDDLEIAEESGMQARDRQYDLLAEHFKKHVDVDALIKEAME